MPFRRRAFTVALTLISLGPGSSAGVARAAGGEVHLAFPTPSRVRSMSVLQREAVFGIEQARVSELIDTPDALSRPAVQTWLDRAFTDISGRIVEAPDLAALARLRDDMRGVKPFAHDEVQQGFTAVIGRYVVALPGPLADSFLLGAIGQQVYFNAGSFRDDRANHDFVAAVGSDGVLDQIVPNLGAARRAVAASDAAVRSFAPAGKLIDLLTGPAPRVAASAIAAIAAAGVVVASDGARKGSLHTFFEIVRADGSISTFGGYPNGKYALDTSGKLECAFDLEPKVQRVRARLYLAPPAGSTIAAFGLRLTDDCRAFDTHVPLLPYAPLGQNGSFNDNSFTFSMLEHFGAANAVKDFRAQF